MNNSLFTIICDEEGLFAIKVRKDILLVAYLENLEVQEVKAYKAGVLNPNIYTMGVFRPNNGLSTICDMQVLFNGLKGIREPSDVQMDWLLNHFLPTLRLDKTCKGNFYDLIPTFLK